MSRIFVTDDSILFLKAIKLTEASGLDRYHTIKEKGLNVAVFEKRIISAGNYYQKNTKEYIAAVGLFIKIVKGGRHSDYCWKILTVMS